MEYDSQGDELDPAFWADFSLDALQKHDSDSFSAQTLVPDVLKMQPENKTVNEDIRSFFNVICSRLDRIEATMSAMSGDFRETKTITGQVRDGMLRLEFGIEIVKGMVETMRKNMSAFSRNLFRFFGGHAGDGSVVADTDST